MAKKGKATKDVFTLLVGNGSKNCPVHLLNLDANNPRLKTGEKIEITDDKSIISALAEFASLEELIVSICTNDYINLEPLIVMGSSDHGPFTVLEGNRRLAAIKLINNPSLAKELDIKVPSKIKSSVIGSIKEVLAHRVKGEEQAKAFIGFKHIKGPQRWDAYAKARYATEWYKASNGQLAIADIANKLGDNTSTLKSYIYGILILEQAENKKIWSIRDRSNPGPFGFSHFYTALGRKEYQELLGLTGEWADNPEPDLIPKNKLDNLREILVCLYGSKSDDRRTLIRSQNPDLKNVGLTLVNPEARAIIAARGTLEEAMDALKEPSDAYYDALISASLKLSRAIKLMPKYEGGREDVDKLVDEIYEQSDTLKTMNDKKKKVK